MNVTLMAAQIEACRECREACPDINCNLCGKARAMMDVMQGATSEELLELDMMMTRQERLNRLRQLSDRLYAEQSRQDRLVRAAIKVACVTGIILSLWLLTVAAV